MWWLGTVDDALGKFRKVAVDVFAATELTPTAVLRGNARNETSIVVCLSRLLLIPS